MSIESIVISVAMYQALLTQKSFSNEVAFCCSVGEFKQNMCGELFHSHAKRADSDWNDWNSPTEFRRAMLNLTTPLVLSFLVLSHCHGVAMQ